jgi:hypothetical protein
VAAVTRLRRRTVERLAVTVGHEDVGRLEHRLRVWADATDLAVVAPGTYDADGARFEVSLLPGDVDLVSTLLAESGLTYGLEPLGQAVRSFPA